MKMQPKEVGAGHFRAIPSRLNVFFLLIFVFLLLLFVSLYIFGERSTTLRLSSLNVSRKLDVDDVVRFPASYFAICAIVKNENNLPQWIEYHYRLGCDKFYIYDDNNSTYTISMKASVQPYIDKGIVDYHVLTDGDRSVKVLHLQLHVFNEKCIKLHSKKHSFMGFIDSDEFIVLPTIVNATQLTHKNSSNEQNGHHHQLIRSIPEVLKHFEPYGGVTLSWMVFGSSGHIDRPPGGVIEHYTKCCINKRVKTIVNTIYVLRDNGNPHAFLYKDNKYAVDTTFHRVSGPFNQPFVPKSNEGDNNKSSGKANKLNLPLYSTMYINHYHTRSLEDFRNKIARGRFNKRNFSVDYFENKKDLSMDYFDNFNKMAVDDCPVLQMPPPTRKEERE